MPVVNGEAAVAASCARMPSKQPSMFATIIRHRWSLFTFMIESVLRSSSRVPIPPEHYKYVAVFNHDSLAVVKVDAEAQVVAQSVCPVLEAFGYHPDDFCARSRCCSGCCVHESGIYASIEEVAAGFTDSGAGGFGYFDDSFVEVVARRAIYYYVHFANNLILFNSLSSSASRPSQYWLTRAWKAAEWS